MPLFNLNEVQFDDSFNRDFGEDSFALNSFRYPLDVGTARYNHTISFEIFVRDRINSDFGVQTESGDPVEYQIRRQLQRTRGSSISSMFSGGAGSLNNSVSSDISNPIRSNQQVSSTTTGFVSGQRPAPSFNAGNSVPGRRGTNYEQNATYAGQRNQTAAGSQNLTTEATAGPGFRSLERAARKLQNDLSGTFNTLKRARENITLYMPDNLNFDYSHEYQSKSISSVAPIAFAQQSLGIGGAIGNITGAFKNKTNFSPFLAEMIDNRGLEGVFRGSLGYAINPQFEVLYTSPNLRTFQFDFQFYPRSESEALQVHRIINSFKFHAAPEIVSGTFGRFLLAPSAFDIKFHYNGQINPNIPKISTCYLQSVSTDYAPNGFSAYEVQGQNSPSLGGTGTPVAIRLQLQFIEGTMVTKELLRGQNLSTLTTGGASF